MGTGGSPIVINSHINVGTLIADDSGIEMLSEKVGEVITRDVRNALNVATGEDTGLGI
jgi:hypothetical protein